MTNSKPPFAALRDVLATVRDQASREWIESLLAGDIAAAPIEGHSDAAGGDQVGAGELDRDESTK